MQKVLCVLMSLVLFVSALPDGVLNKERFIQDYRRHVFWSQNVIDDSGIKEMEPDKAFPLFSDRRAADEYMAQTSQARYLVSVSSMTQIEVQTERGNFGLEITNAKKSIGVDSRSSISFSDGKIRLDVPASGEYRQDEIMLTITPPEGGLLEHRTERNKNFDDYVTISNAEGVIIGFITHGETEAACKYKFELEDNKVIIKPRADDYPDPGGSYSIIIQGTSYYFSDFFSNGTWITRDGVLSLSLTRKMAQWDTYYVQLFGLNESIMADQTWSLVCARFQSSPEWVYYDNEQGLYEQYVCHVFNAIDKNPFNLEPDRPVVGYALTVLAGCNP